VLVTAGLPADVLLCATTNSTAFAVLHLSAPATAAVTARAKLESAIQGLLAAAARHQPSVLQQVQSDLLSLLQLVVLPELTVGGHITLKEPMLSAVSRIIKGRSCIVVCCIVLFFCGHCDVLPELTAGGHITPKEPTLSAVSRIIKGRFCTVACCCLVLLSCGHCDTAALQAGACRKLMFAGPDDLLAQQQQRCCCCM
jgi:hypothetical protein